MNAETHIIEQNIWSFCSKQGREGSRRRVALLAFAVRLGRCRSPPWGGCAAAQGGAEGQRRGRHPGAEARRVPRAGVCRAGAGRRRSRDRLGAAQRPGGAQGARRPNGGGSAAGRRATGQPKTEQKNGFVTIAQRLHQTLFLFNFGREAGRGLQGTPRAGRQRPRPGAGAGGPGRDPPQARPGRAAR